MPGLIEPLGLLHGAAARDAVASGVALALPGGGFALARLIEGERSRIVAAPDLPPDWRRRAASFVPAPVWADLPSRPLVMAVLNVTPDSFSDGGLHAGVAEAVAAGQAMVAAGADILDIGGETTRPRAQAVPPEEEQRRILPVIAALCGAGVPISVDTRNAATMAAAVAAGAAIVNDVSGLAHDPDAAATVARLGCAVVIMHMRGDPATMDGHANYTDVAVEVTRELALRVEAAATAGIGRDRIAVDPGLGFAKTGAQNVELLDRLPVLLNLGCRILVGASRKRFVRALTGEAEPRRNGPGSIAAHLHALSRGASILRVHDVAETVQAVRVWRGLAG